MTVSKLSRVINTDTQAMTKSSLAQELGVTAKTITRYELIAFENIEDYYFSKLIGGTLKLKTPLLPYHQFCLRKISDLMGQLRNAELVAISIKVNVEKFKFENFTNSIRTVNYE